MSTKYHNLNQCHCPTLINYVIQYHFYLLRKTFFQRFFVVFNVCLKQVCCKQ